ncbi:hypothetical protein LCGC14_0511190 [marine sediment metagenome]|uniref:Uncharacterized protein n=1 Tax=marine sediment metagenome TaxID=412755 RepID=A0A0F9V9J4_9ZZZZ
MYCGKISNAFNTGLRWTGVSGLSGATISTVVLSCYGNGTYSTSFIGDWYGEDGAAPGTFTSSSGNISGRTQTTATCEGDGADFGTWYNNTWNAFEGDGTNTLADIIQELADSYDPSAIVLIHYWVAGNGVRQGESYEGDSALAPKLDITYTAGTGDQVATPTPVAVPISVPTPTSVGGSGTVTMTPSAIAVPVGVPTPTLSIGGMTMTPSAVPVPVAVPTPALSIGAVTMTPTPVAIPIAIPEPTVVGGATIFPTPVQVPISVPTPTLSIGAVTMTPTPVALPIVVPTPALPVTMTPTPVVVTIAVPTPSRSIGAVTLTPTPVAVPIVIPNPTVLGAVTKSMAQWGKVERYINPDQYTVSIAFFLEVGLFTIGAVAPVTAWLYNVTDGLVVLGSEITGTKTYFEVKRSDIFTLPSGLRKYRLEFGGEPGGVYFFHGGDVVPIAS